MKGIWTRERTDLLKRLWSEGKTATAIAASLDGISRAAVLGKIFRLRLGAAGNTAAEAGSNQALDNETLLGVRRRGRLPVRLSEAPAGKSLLELNNASCRWPYGRPGTKAFHYCGVTGADLENGRPYCEHHMRRAYLAPERKPQRQQQSAAPAQPLAPRTITFDSARTGQSQRPFANFRRSRI
jgi:GcrA cell cycle regulator